MPADGDTKLVGPWITLIPEQGEEDVIVELPYLFLSATIFEYQGWAGGWVLRNEIRDISNIVFNIDPEHSTDTPSFDIPDGGGAAYITIPSNENFKSETEYTWTVSMNIEHRNLEYGWIWRSYTTTQMYSTLAPHDELFGPLTFTTGYAFSPPSAGEEYGGEGGKTFMRTVRRLVAVGRNNKVYYEDS